MNKKLRMRVPLEGRMEVFVVVPRSKGSACVLPRGSVVKDVLDRFVSQQVSPARETELRSKETPMSLR